MNIYEKVGFKKLLAIPLILAVIMLWFASQINFGMDLKGGYLITIKGANVTDVKNALSEFNLVDLNIREGGGLEKIVYVEFLGEKRIIEMEDALNTKDYAKVIALGKGIVGEINKTQNISQLAQQYFSESKAKIKSEIIGALESKGIRSEDISYNEIGPALGAFFLSQAINAIIIAFIFIFILVFFFFKTPIISFAVVQAALFDVLFGLGGMSMLKIELSLPTFAALLMLIGYSIDTDIMLTQRLLKEGGKADIKLKEAFKTGITMTGTTLAALTSLLLSSWLGNIPLLVSISSVLIIGLIGDLISTWITNASIVLWYVRRKAR